MGKMVYALTFVFTVELALYLFGAPGASTTFFGLLSNLSDQGTNYLLYFQLFTGGVAVMLAGAALFFNIYSMYAQIATGFFLFASPLISLWIFINSSVANFGGAALTSSGGIFNLSSIVAALVVGPLFVWFVIVTLDWIRGTDQ